MTNRVPAGGVLDAPTVAIPAQRRSSEPRHFAPGRPARRMRSATKRRWIVLFNLAVVFGLCLAGYFFLIDGMRDVEIAVIVWVCNLFGVSGVSGILDNALLLSPPGEVPVVAAFTTSCSALLSIVALAGMAYGVMRRRRGHAILAFAAAALLVFVANTVRIILVVLAGVYWGTGALMLFHDWVGTILNFIYTFVGLLVMISITLPNASRAEQDLSGRHIASRPGTWGRQGHGYRPANHTQRAAAKKSLFGSVDRYLPAWISVRRAARREVNRVDYRLGNMTPAARATRVRQLAKDGLGAHTATLLAVASYDDDPMVLDTLAASVAERQWEPNVSEKVVALRLWARAWTLRPGRTTPVIPLQRNQNGDTTVAVTGAGGPAGVTVVRALRTAGYTVIALDADPSAVGFHLASQGVQVPYASDPAYTDALFNVVRTHQVQALVCTVAEEYPTIIPLAGTLERLGCRTWFPSLDAVEDSLDKARFAERMRDAGVPHPETVALDVASPADVARVPGPWVVKPRRGRGSRGVVLVDDPGKLPGVVRSSSDAICQTRIEGREFTADALVDRFGRLLTCVPRWRAEVKAGISVKGETFDSSEVTEMVEDTLRALALTGPANVQGFVREDGSVVIVEVNPRFSGGLPLTLAAGADVVGAYLSGILSPDELLEDLSFVPGTVMARHYAEVFVGPDGTPVPDPLSNVKVH